MSSGELPDPLRDRPAVQRLERDRLQDQQIDGALNEIGGLPHDYLQERIERLFVDSQRDRSRLNGSEVQRLRRADVADDFVARVEELPALRSSRAIELGGADRIDVAAQHGRGCAGSAARLLPSSTFSATPNSHRRNASAIETFGARLSRRGACRPRRIRSVSRRSVPGDEFRMRDHRVEDRRRCRIAAAAAASAAHPSATATHQSAIAKRRQSAAVDRLRKVVSAIDAHPLSSASSGRAAASGAARW